MLSIQQLNSQAANFEAELERLLAWESVSDTGVQQTVTDIIQRIRTQGDAALMDLTARLDGWQPADSSALEISKQRLQQASQRIPAQQLDALRLATGRIRSYAERQKLESWQYEDADGTLLGQQVSAMERVGLYVPGGKAAYPSSVLMNAIPARVAGVDELIMVVPTPAGELNELVLAAAELAEVDRVFAIGGAQAVAALAWGTETIPAVDKIVGPGNIYVATAKRAVFGQVGIDMVAGPSEILIVCDGQTDANWIAMDLFSQAEHDEDAQSILISPDAAFLEKVKTSLQNLLTEMERADIIREALQTRGALIQVADLDDAVRVANIIAPEHLELSVAEPQAMAQQIRHAGAIFMGRYTAEAMGDYCAGPNHVLPTSRTARFSSPLGVYDFQKRSSLIMASQAGASCMADTCSVLARGEGLIAHARSAEYRRKS